MYMIQTKPYSVRRSTSSLLFEERSSEPCEANDELLAMSMVEFVVLLPTPLLELP